MPAYHLRLVNADFESSADEPFDSVETATRAGLEGATSIARESLLGGECSTAVEVRVEEDGRVVARQVVTLSVSELSPDK